jgi:FMN-dependent oxidoreductase (nitrilotriacetate monooxygenase family)
MSHRKQVILGAHFPGVNNQTVWSDPAAGSQIEFSSFAHMARTAERGKFDFFFLAEGLRLREQGGLIYDLDVVGRPDTITVLSALAAVTDRLGLAGTQNATFNEPYDLARKLATLAHVSDGRAGWNVVTSPDAFTGANFRRGGYLDYERRYERAAEIVRTVWELWDSWPEDAIAAEPETGTFLRDGDAGAFDHQGSEFIISGHFTTPHPPKGFPVIIQAGDSEAGREFAAETAEVIFSAHGVRDEARAFYDDVKGRLARYGRGRDELKIVPAATFVLGDSPDDARERATVIRRQQVSGATAIRYLEQVWNRDLSGYDPEGPLPEVEPDPTAPPISQGRTRNHRDRLGTVAEWRELAAAKRYSIRDLVIEVTSRRMTFVGTPSRIAQEIDDAVTTDAIDGLILVPHVTPGGLDAFVDRVVPLLQERGVLRAEYAGSTLREHLGLPTRPRYTVTHGSTS